MADGICWLIEVLLWGIAGPFDRARIRRYLRGQAAQLVAARWTPFATGWLSNWGQRCYEIEYIDANGADRRATCCTGLGQGVAMTDGDGAEGNV